MDRRELAPVEGVTQYCSAQEELAEALEIGVTMSLPLRRARISCEVGKGAIALAADATFGTAANCEETTLSGTSRATVDGVSETATGASGMVLLRHTSSPLESECGV